MTDQPPSGPIELVLPADTRLVRVARLVASGVGHLAGFDVDQLDDLRIAVDELCAALVEGGSGAPLQLRFTLDDVGCVDVRGATLAANGVEFEPERLALSRQILAVVVDKYTIDHVEGELQVHLQKRRADA